MLINHPPGFDNATLEKQLWEATPRVLSERGMDMLMRYQAPSGAIRDRLIGANWLAGRVPGLGPERVLVCPGAQGALLVTSLMLARAGDTIGVEALTYPGFILLARELGITLAPVQMDEHGARPDSLDELCRNGKLKAFYCTPIIQNPTTINMPIERRLELVEVARHHQLPIIEDDNYWPLVNHSSTPGVSLSEFPSLASLAPELVYYISGLAKCVSPALRIAYLAVPDEAAADRASVVLRATASMAAPLSAAIATYWIESGLAQDMLRAICIESKERQAIAQRVLGSDLQTRHGLGFHLWLPLPSPWTQSAFVAQLRLAGISVADSDSFAVANAADGVRLCLGAIRTRSDLEHCMQRVSDTLHFKTYESSQVI
jgi:DNA-binding transcriptional MocR family regulator